MEKLQQDTRNNQLQADLDRTKDEKNDLEDRIMNLESMQNKIEKQNELVEELNTQFYGLSIDELGQEINQSMFNMVLDLRSSHLKHIIDGTLDLKYALKEDGKLDLAAQLEEIQNLKEQSEYESEDEGEEGEGDKKQENKVENPHKSLPKPEEDQNKPKRVGGGFVLETDAKMEKEDRVKDKIEKKKQEEWKKFVENAKKNNEILRMLMNLSNEKIKDKDGNWVTKPSFGLMKRNMKKLANDKNSFLGKAFSIFWRNKQNEAKKMEQKYTKENENLRDQIDTYAKMLTFTTTKIIKYVLSVKTGIDDIEENYKGLFSTRDKQLIRMITEAGDKDGEKKADPKVMISDLKREVSDLRNEINQLKIVNNDLELDVQKYKKKEHSLKSKMSKLDLEIDEVRHRYEMRISEYKTVIRAKDEEITSLKEHIRSQEKLTRDYASKQTSSGYELESTKKKLAESRHHQDMLTKRVREYEDVVRVMTKNMKQNTEQSNSSHQNSKSKEQEISTIKKRNKVLEEALHKREEALLNLKSTLKKLQIESKYKDDEIDKLHIQGNFDSNNLEFDKKTRDYVAQIEVLKEMINGLKGQLKAKDMDGYRQETKILSLQSQIDTLRARELQLESQMGYNYNNAAKYTPANVHKTVKLKSNKVKNNFEDSYSKSVKHTPTRTGPQHSKPLIKSSIKVQNKKKDDDEDEDPLQRIMSTKLKNEPIVYKKPTFDK